MPLSPDARILRQLRDPGEYCLASDLGAPGLIPERIAGLRSAGYEIEEHPHRGYRLISSPDRLIADDILSRLPECRLIRDVLVFENTGSTNDVIAKLGKQGVPEGIVAFAEHQTAGRGRLGRRWESGAAAGLWFSLLTRPSFPLSRWTRLTLWAAHAVAVGIERTCGLQVMLKWPNDLYAGGRKLVGILVESSPGQDNPFAVAGIGINVNQEAFSGPLAATATSLRIETGSAWDRNTLAASVLAAFDQTYPSLDEHFSALLDWASERDFLRGKWVAATVGASRCEGMAEGIDDTGALILRNAQGAVTSVSSGEVTRIAGAAPWAA